jgi:predicted HicB family RNase H-like nuclease
MDTKAIQLRLSPELYRRIRVLAAKEEKSASQWMREALKLVADRVEEQDA